MPYLQVLRSRLFYHDIGRGRPLLFIHGACENSGFWKNQIGRIPAARTIAFDLPGHGKSSLGSEVDSIAGYSDVVRRFIGLLRLEGAVAVGHSMGGAIAIELALQPRSPLAGLVLANTGAKLGVLPQILSGLRKNSERTLRQIILPRALFSNTKLRAWVLRQSLSARSSMCWQDYNICNTFDRRESISEISIPVAIVAGEHDALTPVKWSHFMHQEIANSRLIAIEKTAHLTMLEEPEKFNQVLAEFLERLDREP